MIRNLRLKASVFSIIIASVMISCGGKYHGISNPIEGTWQRCDKNGRKLNITFNKNGEYNIAFHSINLQFKGNYSVSGDMVRIVDLYCGTALPGIYRWGIKGKELHFTAVNDSFCDRRKILPGGTWKPDQSNGM